MGLLNLYIFRITRV